MKKPSSYVYQRNIQTSLQQQRVNNIRSQRQDRLRNRENLNINTNLSSNNVQYNAMNNQNYRKHNSPDANRLRNIQNTNQIFMSKNYKGNNRNTAAQDNLSARQYQDIKRQRSNAGNQGFSTLNSKQITLTKNASSPKLLQINNNNSNIDQGAQNEQNNQKKSQKMLTQTDQYQKLHQKLNSIQDKIMNMKKNIQKKRQQKQKMIQKQKKQKLEQQQKQLRAQSQQKNIKNPLKGLVTQVPEHKQLHTFQRNPYSSRHNIYYVSQVVRAYLDEKSLAREHILTSLHILRILERTQVPSEEQMKRRQVNLPYKKGKQGKKCVVFDLDQTLIHCNDSLTPPHDVKLPIKFPTGQIIEAGINIRPYAKQILKNLAKNFQVIVFTASHSCYANVVLDYLDPNNEFIDHRLFRQHCYQTPQGMYVKDLRVMNRDLKDVVLVDNAAYSYAFQLQNGIPILPYYHGSHDYQLNTLQKYLNQMLLINDVRTLIKKTFCLHKYKNYYSEPQRMVQELYMNQEIQSNKDKK